MDWCFCFGFGGFAIYLEDIATLCWLNVFGGSHYDALALSSYVWRSLDYIALVLEDFLYLEDLNYDTLVLG